MQDNQNTGRYFSQEELDAIVSGSVTPKMPTDIGPVSEESGTPVWDTADTLMAVPRGAVGAAKGVWNFADWATFDLLPDWHTNPLGSSKSMIGGFVEGVSQVGTGFLVGGGILGVASKIPGAVGSTAAWLGGVGGGTAATVRAGLTKGVMSDFLAFEATDARLSDLLVQSENPVLNNVVTQYLASDMEDGELEGRLKNALEGGVVGVAFEGVVKMLKGSVKASKAYRAAKAAGEPEEAAVKKAMDVAGDDLKEGQDLMAKAEFGDVADRPLPDRPQMDRGVDAAVELELAFKINKAIPLAQDVSDLSIKRGSGAIVDRINREASMGRLDRADANFMVDLVGRIGDDAFNRFGVRFRNMGDHVQGSFDFLTDVLTVSNRARSPLRTFVHEVWHALTGRIDDKMIVAVNKDFQKALRKFEKTHGLEKGSLQDGLNSKARKIIAEKNLEKSEWYRLTDLDEWVAENMTDATLARLDLEADTKSVLGFLRYFTSNFLTEFKAKFGGDKYNKLAKDWLDKRYSKAPEVAQGIDRSASQRLGYMRDAEALDVGGPNYGVPETRRVILDPNVGKEMADILAGGGDKNAIAESIRRYDEAGVINFSRILRGQGTAEELYEEAVAVLRQYEANPNRFKKAPSGSNKATRDAAKAAVLAIEETGGANIAALKAMVAKGTIAAEEVFKVAPVLEGIELHLRSKMLQALRNPAAADPKVMAQAWTSVAGSVEKFFSFAGKTLQVRQAFDTSAKFMDEISKLSPEQRKVLANGMADTLQYLILDPKTGKEMAKVLTESTMMKGIRVVTELHRNSILSGPKTLAVNVWSGAQMLLMPLERAVGRLGARQGVDASRELSTITRYWAESKSAFQAAKASLYAEGDSITLGRGNTQYGEFAPSRALTSRNNRMLNTADPATGGVNRTIPGAAVDFIGQVVGTPTRLMGTSDEFFTSLTAHAEADVVLRRIVSKNLKKPMTDLSVSSEVERLKKTLFVDGQLYTRKTVLERGMKMVREKYVPKALMETLKDSVASRAGLPATDPAVVAEASRLMREMTDPTTGKVKSISEIRKMKDADVMVPSLDAAGTRAMSDPLFIPEVQRFVDQNWDQYVDSDVMPMGGRFQEQPGQDYRILQQASKEIERRVREVTWKRDYDDMAESSVALTRLVGNVGRATSGVVNHIPAMQLVIPFIRTPTNLLAYVTDRNPISQSLAWMQAAKAGDKDAMAEAVGRLSTGTLMFGTATVLAANGMITGRGPKDTALKNQLLASGWMPYSFKFGDTYVSFGRNDPVATFFGLVADAFEVAQATYDPTPEELGAMETALKATIASVSNNVVSKSYLKGIVTALDALMGNEAAQGQLMRQYAGAVMPNFLAQAENYILDPEIRETRSMWDAIRARTPFLDDSVDKVRNALGEPIKGAEFWGSMLLPGTARTATKDPVKREIAQSLISVGAPRRTLPGGIDLKKITLKSGQSAYDRLQELTGSVKLGGRGIKQQLQSLISSPFYQGLPQMGQDDFDSPRVSLVRGHVSNYRRAAMQQLMKESPELAQAIANSRQAKASMFR
jgi:hypothetical protein